MYKHIRLTLLGVVAAFAVLGSGCATNADNAPAADTADNAVAANTDARPVRECRYAKATGTKMRSRICHSQEVWARLDAAAAVDQDTDDFFRSSREGAAISGNLDPAPTGGAGF